MSAITVLGVDPGSRCTGFGVVQEVSGQARLVVAGCIRLDPKQPASPRLGELFARVQDLIGDYGPQAVAVETVFAARNPDSALKLGQARGAVLAACGRCGVPVFGYAPTVVKKAVTGVGRAEKEQVRFMVGRILGAGNTLPLDASDALAVAICYLHHQRLARLAAVQTAATLL